VEGAVMKVVLTYTDPPGAEPWRARFEGDERFGQGANPRLAVSDLLRLCRTEDERRAVRWALRDEMVKDGSLPQ
jgi:hypothetical protein